jgi:hypothetical protein
MGRLLPVVQELIAAPCEVPSSTMKGDDRLRHCAQCDRDVHNLSAMTYVEIDAFFYRVSTAPSGEPLPCASVFKRTDGTILTADCPVGLSRRQRRAVLTSTLTIGGIALAAATALATLIVGMRTAPVQDEPVDLFERHAAHQHDAFQQARVSFVIATQPPPPSVAYPQPVTTVVHPSVRPSELGLQMSGAMMMQPRAEQRPAKVVKAKDDDTAKALEALRRAQLQTSDL